MPRHYELILQKMRLKRKIEVEHNSLNKYGYVASVFVLDLKGNLN